MANGIQECAEITNYQGNANQNHIEVHLTSAKMAIVKKAEITSIGENMEKRKPFCTI